MKNLLLITAGFPFGTSETFLENELPIIAKHFQKVTILALDDGNGAQRYVPENCEVNCFDLSDMKKVKLKALSLVGNKLVKAEKQWIKKQYQQKLLPAHQKIMLISLAKAKLIAKWIKNNIDDPSSTVAYSYWGDDAAIALALLQRKQFFAKAVCRVHGWDVYFEVHEFQYLPFRNLLIQSLDKVFTISEKGKEIIQTVWKTPVDKVEISRLGVKEQSVSARLNSKILVSCSNMIALKRIGLIIEALKNIPFSMEWVHFGDGTQFEALKKMAKELPQHITVRFKGRVSNEAVLEFYRAAQPTTFINVSSSEGVPVSIMEAFSFGIPVIATEVGGNGEIVNDDNGVLLAAHPSEKEVAQAIASIFESTAEAYDRKRHAAYATWENDYNAEKNYVGFVHELLK